MSDDIDDGLLDEEKDLGSVPEDDEHADPGPVEVGEEDEGDLI
jgi:hypothetical protein